MKQKPTDDVRPLVSRIHRLVNKNLALENDFLRAENRMLHDLLGDTAHEATRDIRQAPQPHRHPPRLDAGKEPSIRE